MRFIADTGFVLARWSKSAARRRWFNVLAEQQEPPFISCDAVLMEAGWRLGQPRLAPQLIRDGDYLSMLSLHENAEELLWLLDKYSDREMDLADACVVKLAELYPDATVLTTDQADFSVYRTRAGHKLKCNFGPE